MDDIRAMFLRQSLSDCEDAFAEMVERPDILSWDWMVITAANEAQAEAFRAQIDQRLAAGQLPRQTRYAVIPDPDGKRVGSGGATLNVLREIARAEGGDAPFEGKRILVLHSGGDSQRIPQYSACGKLFAHVPRALRDGRPSTLFDEFCVALACVPARMHDGMLLASGDVLLLFNALQIDLERMGAACLTIKAPVETGTHHGVYVSDGEDHVAAFLHKQPEAVLRASGAVNAQDMVDIDTGAVWLDAARVAALHSLVADGDEAFDAFVNEHVRLSLYADFVYPMSGEATLDAYLREAPENMFSDELSACRKAIWQVLGNTRLAMIRLAPAEFIHFGTTREWRDLMLDGGERFGFLGWQRTVMSFGAEGQYAAINSIIAPGARIAEGCAIEDSRIGPGAVIGEGSVISGADFDGELAANSVLHVLPLADGSFCARRYGVLDNPKEAARFGIQLREALWTAPLHPVRGAMDGAIEASLADEADAPVLSLKDGFARASVTQILARQEALGDEVRAYRVSGALAGGASVQAVLPLLSGGQAGQRQRDMLSSQAEDAPFPLQHRLYYTLARAEDNPTRRMLQDDACWQAINDHLLADGQRALAELPAPRIIKDRVDVSLPVRVNWGGGWSDTPPYCLEHGGTVLNASVLLSGQRPVSATVQRLAEPVIRIESDDLGVHRTYTRMEALATGNPHDPHALCKAALAVCGVVPVGAKGPLAPVLSALGGGIMLRTSVRGVPKGSGLGTSSVLCAAVARALAQMLGQPEDDERISSLALCMEQLMNTGGGWQDQIGGLLPGIKLVSSRPGTPQKLTWRQVQMDDAAFADFSRRHVLVFTGQRRMARNILRDIMGKAVSGNPETMSVLASIQRLAVLMAFELETGDIDQFGHLLREHWALSKRLDAGSSNTCIDHMVSVCDDLIDGMMICGAGGGGFMSMLLRRDVPREALEARLESVFQESGVRVWDATLEK